MAGATIAVTGAAIEIDALSGVIETMIAVSAVTEGNEIIGIAICFKTGRMPVTAMSVAAVKMSNLVPPPRGFQSPLWFACDNPCSHHDANQQCENAGFAVPFEA